MTHKVKVGDMIQFPYHPDLLWTHRYPRGYWRIKSILTLVPDPVILTENEEYIRLGWVKAFPWFTEGMIVTPSPRVPYLGYEGPFRVIGTIHNPRRKLSDSHAYQDLRLNVLGTETFMICNALWFLPMDNT